MEVTPCFVHLRRIDEDLLNLYFKKYGLKVKAPSGNFEREETHKESLTLWPGTMSKKEKSLKRKGEHRDDSSSKIRQKYSPKEKIGDSSPSHKYFSNSETHKFNFSMKRKTYLEHETSCPCKFNQKKKNFFKVGSPIVKILEEKKRSERKKIREKNKCSKQICQSKVKVMMKKLRGHSETREEKASSDAFAHFSEQRFKNVNKTPPIIHTCKNKNDDDNNSAVLVSGGKQLKGVDEESSQFKQVVESEQNIVANVLQTEKNDELYTVGERYGSRICDTNLSSDAKNEALRTNNLSLDEDEYDSRGEDSEDDKQTVIFSETFDTLGKLKESSEKVSECKQPNGKTNIKGGKLKSSIMLKRRKSSLVRIIKKGKMTVRKKLGKPTRKFERKATERRQTERSKETLTRSQKFVEKFEDILGEVSNLVKHLHDTHKIIIHLKKDMEENEKLAEHFKTVIKAQQENYRKEIWRNQETIMKGYDIMMSFCKKSSTVSLEISKRTFLSIEDVEDVLSRCILVENALEMLKSTQKLSTVEKNILKETEDQGMKEWSIESVATSGDSSEIIGKEPHGQIISFNECQDQLAQEKALRISNKLYPQDSVNPLAKHLAFSNSATSVPCSISTYALKESQVMPPRQGTGDTLEGLVLHKSDNHESNHLLTLYQSSQKSRVNFINKERGQDHHKNSTPTADFLPGRRRSDFIQLGKPRQRYTQPGNNVQNQLLNSQMRHCLQQQQLTKSLSRFLTSGSVQQIFTTKRPPRPQNPIPHVFQPEVEMNSNRDKQQCHQQQDLMHSSSVQRRINIESNFPVPLSTATSGSVNQSRSSYLPHLMKSNASMFGPYTLVRGFSKPLPSRNNITGTPHSMPSQNVIPSHLPQPNTITPNASNTSAVSTSTPVRSHTSTIPVLPRQFQSLHAFSKNLNSCRMTTEVQRGLRVSNPIQNIPSSTKALHPIAQSSGSLNLAVAEQFYVSKANERALQGLRKSKSSVPCGSCMILTSPTAQKSKSEPQLLDPTVPQKLTMKNQRLQAGTILISSGEVTKSESQPDENQMNRMIKTESMGLEEQEKVPETQKIVGRNPSRKYECAQNGCKNSGIRICKGCESVIYCSGTCHLNHWKQKHKEECAKLRALRG